MRDETEIVPHARDPWQEALDWHTYLKEAGEAEQKTMRAAWLQWKSDPENSRIFEQLSIILDRGSRAHRRALPTARNLDYSAKNPPSVSSSPSPSPQAVKYRRSSLGGRAKFMGLAAALGLMLLSVPVQQLRRANNPKTLPQVHRTAVGEVRTDTLEDGSTVTLGADSQISVEFSADHRAISLDRGDAWFKVAHDAKWPFEVIAGQRTIVAVGTAFVVRRRADDIVVTVTDGSVEVAALQTVEAQPLLVRAAMNAVAHFRALRMARGQQMTYQETGPVSAVERTDTQAATSWTEGQLEFDHVRLREVVQVVNRYSHRTIGLDPDSSGLIFTGLILQNQIDEWLRGLAGIYPVEVIQKGTQACIHRRGEELSHTASLCGSLN
jgi:transmembrane sensor